MNLETSKIELVKIILSIDNDTFIQKVSDFIKNEKSDFWNELNPNQQEEIKKGLEMLDKGRKVSYQEVLKKIS